MLDPVPITLAIDRADYRKLDLRFDATGHCDVLADLGRGEGRYRVLRAVFDPGTPRTVDVTFLPLLD